VHLPFSTRIMRSLKVNQRMRVEMSIFLHTCPMILNRGGQLFFGSAGHIRDKLGIRGPVLLLIWLKRSAEWVEQIRFLEK
jgi:hypothetical protein